MRLADYHRGCDPLIGDVGLYDVAMLRESALLDKHCSEDSNGCRYLRVFCTPDAQGGHPLSAYFNQAFNWGFGIEIVAQDDRLALSFGEVWSYMVFSQRIYRWWPVSEPLRPIQTQDIRFYEDVPPVLIPRVVRHHLAEYLRYYKFEPKVAVYDHGENTRPHIVLPFIGDRDGDAHLNGIRWFFPMPYMVEYPNDLAPFEGLWVALEPQLTDTVSLELLDRVETTLEALVAEIRRAQPVEAIDKPRRSFEHYLQKVKEARSSQDIELLRWVAQAVVDARDGLLNGAQCFERTDRVGPLWAAFTRASDAASELSQATDAARRRSVR